MKKKHEHKTYDELPGGRLKKGDHVRQFMSKLKQRFTGPVGIIIDFVNVKMKGRGMVWRACVSWRPQDAEPYDQMVDAELLDKIFGDGTDQSAPLFERDQPTEDENKCDCGGDLKFDPDLVGDTVGGLTLRGWDVCEKCGKAWLAREGAVAYEGAWKLTSGGRSVETGNGRIRIDGGNNVEALIARIAKLPDLELEVAHLRKNQRTNADEFREREAKVPPGADPSPWQECKFVVNGTKLEDGDRILKINQPEPKDNGVYIVRLERP